MRLASPAPRGLGRNNSRGGACAPHQAAAGPRFSLARQPGRGRIGGPHPGATMTTFLLTLLTALPAGAGEKANTLTAKQIADGWVLLFDGETTFGWAAASTAAGVKPELSVRDGQLVLGRSETYAGCTTRLRYFEIAFDYRTEGSDDAGFSVSTPPRGAVPGHVSGFGLQHAQGERWGHAHFRFAPGRQVFRLEAPGRAPFEHARELPKGHGVAEVQFRPDPLKPGKLFVRNVKLRPLETKPVFNARDLSGWKEIPGKKSKFSVTKEGWLNVKAGPGDLQTEGKWGDFVL